MPKVRSNNINLYYEVNREGLLVVISDAHHATPMEQPERFNAVLTDLLAKHI